MTDSTLLSAICMPTAYMHVRLGSGCKLGVSSGWVSLREMRVATHIYGASDVIGRGGAGTLGLSAIRPLRQYPGHPGPGDLRKTSSASILFPGAAGEGHAVPGPVGDAEVPLRAFRHLFEKVGWRPVDEFHQEAVRERADDLERQFVHDVRRNRDLMRGRVAADSHRLGKTVGAANVGHEIARGAALDELPELEARVVVLAGRDGDLDRVRDFGAGRYVVGEHRLLVPHEVELFERLCLPDVPEDV